MQFMRRLFSMLLTFVMIITLSIQTVSAEEPQAQQVELPSQWAYEDVQMASVYGLGMPDNYVGYSESAAISDLNNIKTSLSTYFSVKVADCKEEASSLTRKVIVNELYDIIENVLKANGKMNPEDNTLGTSINFFIDNDLLQGKTIEDYALDDTCSKQELLIFAKRVYEYLAYELNLDSEGALWKVSDEDNTVYLLGSVHVADGSIYPLSRSILDAYEDAEVLAVEANILTIQEDVAYIQQKMFLEGETTIDQVVSEETYEAYVQAIQPLGVAPEMYNKLKPWYAAMLLQSVTMTNASYDQSLGIDVYFLTKAVNQKPIIELEGTRFQIDMFDSFSDALQEQYLLGVLEGEESETIDMVGAILESWKTGDVVELEELLFNTEATSEMNKEFNEKVWQTRNNNMVQKVLSMLTEDDENDYLVVVGAGHMLQDSGIIKQLINEGYTVEQVIE